MIKEEGEEYIVSLQEKQIMYKRLYISPFDKNRKKLYSQVKKTQESHKNLKHQQEISSPDHQRQI